MHVYTWTDVSSQCTVDCSELTRIQYQVQKATIQLGHAHMEKQEMEMETEMEKKTEMETLAQ